MEYMKPDDFTYQSTSPDTVPAVQSSSAFVPWIRSFLLRIFVITYKVLGTYSKHTQIVYEVKKGEQIQGEDINFVENLEGINLQTKLESCPKQLRKQEKNDIPLEVHRQIAAFYRDEEIRRNRFPQGMDVLYEVKVKSIQGTITRRSTFVRPIDSETVYHIIDLKAAEEVEMYLTANRCTLFWHAVRNFFRTYWDYILLGFYFIAFIIGMCLLYKALVVFDFKTKTTSS